MAEKAAKTDEANEKERPKGGAGGADGAADAATAKGPLIPPIVVRFSIIGGILAVMAVGAIFLVTDVIAPRIRKMGAPPPVVEETAPKHEEEPLPTEIFTVADLVVNPAASGGRRYLLSLIHI